VSDHQFKNHTSIIQQRLYTHDARMAEIPPSL